MTTTRDAVLAVSRGHMDKEAGLLNRAGAMVSGGLARGLESLGQGLSTRGIGRHLDAAAIKARQSQLASTKAHIQGQAMSAARRGEREALKTQALAQKSQLRQAGGPEARQALRQQFASAPPSPELAQAPSGQIGARVAAPAATSPPAPVAAAPVAPPPQPTTTAPAPVAQAPGNPMLSPSAKRYLMLGGSGLAGGAMISGGLAGGTAAGQQQQQAPPMYPPGY